MKDEFETLFEENEVVEDQPLSEEEQNLLTLIYDRLDIFQQMNDPFHAEAMECRQILHMKDPKQDDPATIEANGKPTLQLQSLKSTVNNVVADQMLSMPEAKLMPETEGMQEAADDLQDIVHYVVYSANNFENVHYRRCEDFYGTGTAVTQIAWDEDMGYGKGDIALIRWPIESFLWDPLVDNIQDARAVMKVSWHPMSWFREHFPENGKYVGSDDGENSDVGKTEGQQNVDHSNDEDRARLIEYWWRTYDAKKHRYTINVAYAAGNALLEVDRDVYLHGLYPFVIDIHDSQEGSLPGLGLVRELVTMMRYINRYAAYADMNARMSSKARMLVNEQAGIDMDALTDWQTDVIKGQKIIAGESYGWLQPAPFNRAIIELMTLMQSDLKADSGANQFTRGETTGGIVSGKAINSLIQAGGKIASMRTENLKLGFKQMVEQILWLIYQFYDDGRVMMVTGNKGRRAVVYESEKFFGMKNKNNLPPPYAVQIEISSRDPQRIANQNQMFMEAYSMAAQTPYPIRLSSLIKICNLDGKDRILPLIEADEKYNETMQQMSEQIKQMSEQMQNMANENQSLKQTVNDTTNAMQQMSARRGGQAPVQRGDSPMISAEAGGGEDTTNAIASAAMNTLGMQTGQSLPT
jgi:hypothetical protein